MTRTYPILMLLAALVPGQELEAQGRPLQIQVRTELTFVDLLPGVFTTVPPTDALNVGEFAISGAKNSDIEIEFLLPSGLLEPGGAAVALIFGPGSAGFSRTGDITAQVAFDPSLPQTFTLSATGRSSVFLGGTADPPPGIPAGNYSNIVTIQVSYVAN